jgi:hypothetical protein
LSFAAHLLRAAVSFLIDFISSPRSRFIKPNPAGDVEQHGDLIQNVIERELSFGVQARGQTSDLLIGLG